MANSNFVIQNGLTVGPLTIFAGNGDVITTGNLTSAGQSESFVSINNTVIGNVAPATGAFTTLSASGNLAVTNTIYGQGVYDNGNRVLSTSSGSGNLAISGTAVTLPATGPGAGTTGSATAIPVITTDAYGRITALTTASVSSTLNLAGTSGTGTVSLTSQSLTFASTNGLAASASGQTITIGGTVATANVALYQQVTAQSASQAFYPMLSNTSTSSGNTVTGVNSSLSYTPGTGGNGTLSTPSLIVNVGNVTLNGSSTPRIFGNFNDISPSNRMMFQNYTGSAGTFVGVVPTGDNNDSAYVVYSKASPANSPYIQMGMFNSGGEARIATSYTGASMYVPMTFYVSNSERMRIGTNGGVAIGNTTDNGAGYLSVLNGINAASTTLSGTLIAATVNAATIGNTGASLVGTVSTATQNSITNIGPTGANLTTGGNLVVSGNLFVTGTEYIVNQNIYTSNVVATTGLLVSGAYQGSYSDGILVDYVTNIGRVSVGTGDSLSFYNNTESSRQLLANILYTGQFNLPVSGAAYQIGGTSVLNASTLGSGVTASSLTSVGTLTALTVSGATQTAAITSSGTIIAATVNAATIGNSGATLTGTLSTASQTNITAVGTLTSGAIGSGFTAIPNSALANSSITVTAGSGLSGGGAVSLGSSVTLTNAGVTSAVAGTGISVSGATGAVTITNSGVTGLSSSGAGNLTVSASTGSVTVSLPSTGPGATAVGSSTAIPVITPDAYGRIAALSTAAVVAPAGTLTGSTLASGVTASSLTSVGTIGTGTWQGSTIGPTYGGTGVNNGSNTLTLSGSYTLNQSVASGASPTFTATNFSGTASSLNIGGSAPAGSLTGSTLASGVTASSLTSVGVLAGLTVSAAIVPNGNLTVNLGSTSAWWNNIYGTAVHSLYADLAENYQGDRYYNPGTVVMFGGDAEVTMASPETSAVAGIVSTNPAHLMNGGLTGINIVPVALQGRVPCMVIGPVAKGDLMVSAGFGYAKSSSSPSIGTVIGKALQDFPMQAKGVIEVVVGRT